MSKKLTPLTNRELRWLAIAIESHDQWRGQYVGHPDAEPVLENHDAQTKAMRAALTKMRKVNALLRKMPCLLEIAQQ